MASDSKWLDEDPERRKQIPNEKEKVASFSAWRMILRPELFIGALLYAFCFFGGISYDPIFDLDPLEKKISYVIFFVVMALEYWAGRKEKGHVDVYPEMLLFYDYDQFSKKARPSHFFYWKDIVQYHRKENYFWVYSKDKLPERTLASMKKLVPYFRQYAPHAKEVNFNMEDYRRYRLKENRPQDKSPEQIAIEKEMAANREKAKEVLAGAKDVTTMMEEVEAKRQQEEAAARQKAKDFWNNYPEE